MTETRHGAVGTGDPTGTLDTPPLIGAQRDTGPGAPPGPASPAAPAAPEPGPAEGQEAPALLRRSRESVDPELRSALGSLPPAMRRVALYHFGWRHADGTPAAGNAGKAIRPALVLASAAALGGPGARAAAVRAAAAVELVHNFTLLHDDVMDRDTTRRHRPTAWTVFGDADAILAGDALQALALRLIAADPHPASGAAAARLADCVVELCEGQHADTAMERRAPHEVTLDETLAMAEAKTGALLGCACALGALYAGAPEEDVEALDAFGRQAGLAFQLIDDVIGIWGDPGHTGKPAGADLAARKKSLPVVAALASGTPEGAALGTLYAVPYEEGGEDLEHTALTVERAGGRDWAQAQAADRMARAVQELARAVPAPDAAEGLLALAEYVTRRST
ncbi:family 2 encapsulin nanocompartment cargo protein polyprenyl transferase [Streptomyces sp. NRRL F-5065]|uniref:family 2 encapsulin nanocompartment cargo protein polyprenyl transferase n=1 Tax=Streptomyces sp. NRRL F-5065 TaxID=1463855 RepID=UPI0004BF2272|nr:family 2 encapsulin nanocompartment cargo protein polyprenyl transferase [Streptomyces sp. NRRL F-5065]